MVLIIDVGNSNIVFGIPNDGLFNDIFRIETDIKKDASTYYDIFQNYLKKYQFKEVVISSVVPTISKILDELFQTYYQIKPIFVSNNNVNLKIIADDPNEVGADLISDCMGVLKYATNAIIVDLGTANKYLYYKDRCLYGVIISCGIKTSLNALVNNTALLNSIEINRPKAVLGHNSEDCMQSGMFYATKGEIEEIVEAIKKEIKDNPIVILTGGLSQFIKKHLTFDYIHVPNLTLEGIYNIYKEL